MKKKDEHVSLGVLTGRRNGEELQEFTLCKSLWQGELHVATLAGLFLMNFIERRVS